MLQAYTIQLYFEFNIDDNVEHTRHTLELLTTIQRLRRDYFKNDTESTCISHEKINILYFVNPSFRIR